MLTANSVLIDMLAQLLIEKGLIAEEEFFVKLEEVQADYRPKSKNSF